MTPLHFIAALVGLIGATALVAARWQLHLAHDALRHARALYEGLEHTPDDRAEVQRSIGLGGRVIHFHNGADA